MLQPQNMDKNMSRSEDSSNEKDDIEIESQNVTQNTNKDKIKLSDHKFDKNNPFRNDKDITEIDSLP